MKSTIILSGMLLLSVSLFSCKDNTTFAISGTLKNQKKLKTVYLLGADSTAQYTTIDSAALNPNGDYKFRHTSAYVNLYKLKADTAQFDLVAQNGDAIELNSDLADSRHKYTVDGSESSEKIKTFDDFSKTFTDKNNKVITDFNAKSQQAGQQPDSLLKIYMPVFQKNLAAYSDAVLTFINDNKSSLAAFYASTALDAVKYESQLIAYADGIRGDSDLIKNPAVRKFISAMDKTKPLAIGRKAPDFTISSIDGKTVRLSDYKGKYVMVDFWASWCVPCRQENPNVLKQYNTYHKKGFNVLGVSLDKDKAAWQKAVNDDKLAWTQTSDLESFGGPVEQLYHIEAIPSNFIVDPRGNIAAKNIRGTDLEAFLNKTIH